MTRSQRGSSLIESLIVVLILSTILAMTTSVFSFSTRVFSRETVSVDLQEDVAGAANVVLDDLSIAGYRPEDLFAAGPFAAAPTNSFRGVDLDTAFDTVDFWGDVYSDGTTDHICYAVDPTTLTLERSVQDRDADCGSQPAEALADRVREFNLTFLGADRSSLSEAAVTAGNARYVQVTVVVQDDVKGGFVTKRALGETAVRN